jgi:hypothetical protein
MRSRSFAPVAALVWVLVVPVAAPTAVTQDAPSTPDLKGKLYRSVFASGAGSLTATDAATVGEPLRTRLTTYLARRAAFKSLYKSSPDAFEKVRADANRRELERSIVALIDSPGI